MLDTIMMFYGISAFALIAISVYLTKTMFEFLNELNVIDERQRRLSRENEHIRKDVAHLAKKTEALAEELPLTTGKI